MRFMNLLFLGILIVGGLNWLLIGIAQFDLVAALTGDQFGETNLLSSIVYVLVGISAVGLLPTLARWFGSTEQQTA